MKKNNTSQQSRKAAKGGITIGMDLGDKTSRYCVLDGKGYSGGRRQRSNDKEGAGAGIGRNGSMPDSDGSRNAFPMGKPVAEKFGPRGNRSERTAGETDQRQQPQRRPAGRADTGAAGASGSGVVATHPASQ